MSASFPISSPVEFTTTTAGDTLDFNADGPATAAKSQILDFVVTTKGDILYRADDASNLLEKLSIGTEDQVLQVSSGGIPEWDDVPSVGGASGSFLARATAQIGTVAPGSTWDTIDNAVLTWSEAAPGHDAGGLFNPATGVFTVPATGIYDISAVLTWQPNSQGNGGGGIPSRRAIRQARIQKTNATAFTVSFAENQAKTSNLNPTQLQVTATNVLLTSGDTIVLQGRHDSQISLNIVVDVGETYFSMHRVS